MEDAYHFVHAAVLFLPSKVHLVDNLVGFQSRSIFQTRIDLRCRERLNSERVHRQEQPVDITACNSRCLFSRCRCSATCKCHQACEPSSLETNRRRDERGIIVILRCGLIERSNLAVHITDLTCLTNADHLGRQRASPSLRIRSTYGHVFVSSELPIQEENIGDRKDSSVWNLLEHGHIVVVVQPQFSHIHVVSHRGRMLFNQVEEQHSR